MCLSVSRFVDCDCNNDWWQQKTQFWQRLLNFIVYLFLKSTVRCNLWSCEKEILKKFHLVNNSPLWKSKQTFMFVFLSSSTSLLLCRWYDITQIVLNNVKLFWKLINRLYQETLLPHLRIFLLKPAGYAELGDLCQLEKAWYRVLIPISFLSPLFAVHQQPIGHLH